tara:strand:- start:30062 stop:30196 length:135 start_codon:yes stop_codon:yes gene_type:complete
METVTRKHAGNSLNLSSLKPEIPVPVRLIFDQAIMIYLLSGRQR